MKYFLILCGVVALAGFTGAQTWMKNVPECKTKTGASDDYIQNVDFSLPKTKEDTCFLACVKIASKMFDDKNKLNMEAISAYISNDPFFSKNKLLVEKLIVVFQICADQQIDEEDECMAAKKLAECLVPKKLEVLKQLNIPLSALKI